MSDGDTISVMRDGVAVKIRLAEMDAPEKHQPFGALAKRFTGGLVFGRLVQVIPQTKDRYNRVVARVVLSDGRDLSEELVRAGFAWHYKRYSNDQKLAGLEIEAREARRGLWSDKHPIPPWEWRKRIRATPTRKSTPADTVAPPIQ